MTSEGARGIRFEYARELPPANHAEDAMTIQYEYARDVPRRVAYDDASPTERREEWRCSRCEQWFPRASVILIARRSNTAAMPMLIAYCAPCLSETGIEPSEAEAP